MSYSIAILAPSPVPFQMGGAEKSLWALREALGDLPDCRTELIKLPVREDNFEDIISAYERFSTLDLTHFDMLITTKYPAWMAAHPNHVVYMYHPLRGVYDTYCLSGAPQALEPVPAALTDLMSFLDTPEPSRQHLPQLFELCRHARGVKSLPASIFAVPGPLIRKIVRFMDRIALSPQNISSWFALSKTVANRPGYFPPTAEIDVLYLPPAVPGLHEGPYEYFFTVSRLTSSKRIGLLIDAMQYVQEPVGLKIAGTGPELETLKAAAARDRRIEFVGAPTDTELAEYYAHSLAVPFVPLDEDYGLITMEAFASGKPVITTTDAGGPTELVRDGINGFIVPPVPKAIGLAMEQLASSIPLAEQMGKAALACAAATSWGKIARKLVSRPQASPLRRQILVVSPYGADRHGAGGARRLYHICSILAAQYEVKLVAFGSLDQIEITRHMPGPHWEEIAIPWPGEARVEAQRLTRETGTSADDLVLGRYASSHVPFLESLKSLAGTARLMLLVHPWLVDAARQALPDVPIAYEAQNVESDLKREIFGEGELAKAAADLEEKVCREARMIFLTSNRDLQRIAKLYKLSSGKLILLPNGCEPIPHRREKKALRKRLPYKDAKLVLFVGSGHKPNVEAALAIMDMARELPEAQFLLAGSVCGESPLLACAKPPNVHLLDPVSEDVKNVLLESCDLAVNPVVAGSGTNLKMVEYLSAGLPCISTPFGMRGLDPLPGVSICEIDRFPQEIRKLLANPPDETVLAHTASEADRRYGWQTVLQNLNASIARCLDHAPDN